MKRFICILVLAFVFLCVWLYVGIARVHRAQSDVVAHFHQLVDFYVVSSDVSVPSMIKIADLSVEQRSKLQSILKNMQTIAATTDDNFRYALLRNEMKSIRDFLSSPDLPDALKQDIHFQEWSKNMTKLGNASSVLKKYNDALALYNFLRESSHGKIVQLWRTWDHKDFLLIDGTTEETPQVNF